MIKVECLRKFGRNIFNLRKLFWSLMYHSYDLSNLSLGIFNPHSYSVCIGDLSQQAVGCQSAGFNFFTKARFISYNFQNKNCWKEKSRIIILIFLLLLKGNSKCELSFFSGNSFLLMFDVSDFERLLSREYFSSFTEWCLYILQNIYHPVS